MARVATLREANPLLLPYFDELDAVGAICPFMMIVPIDPHHPYIPFGIIGTELLDKHYPLVYLFTAKQMEEIDEAM